MPPPFSRIMRLKVKFFLACPLASLRFASGRAFRCSGFRLHSCALVVNHRRFGTAHTGCTYNPSRGIYKNLKIIIINLTYLILAGKINASTKKMAAPAPWAAAEPETAGKDLRPLPVLRALKKSPKWTNLQIPPESLEFEKWWFYAEQSKRIKF